MFGRLHLRCRLAQTPHRPWAPGQLPSRIPGCFWVPYGTLQTADLRKMIKTGPKGPKANSANSANSILWNLKFSLSFTGFDSFRWHSWKASHGVRHPPEGMWYFMAMCLTALPSQQLRLWRRLGWDVMAAPPMAQICCLWHWCQRSEISEPMLWRDCVAAEGVVAQHWPTVVVVVIITHNGISASDSSAPLKACPKVSFSM